MIKRVVCVVSCCFHCSPTSVTAFSPWSFTQWGCSPISVHVKAQLHSGQISGSKVQQWLTVWLSSCHRDSDIKTQVWKKNLLHCQEKLWGKAWHSSSFLLIALTSKCHTAILVCITKAKSNMAQLTFFHNNFTPKKCQRLLATAKKQPSREWR